MVELVPLEGSFGWKVCDQKQEKNIIFNTINKLAAIFFQLKSQFRVSHLVERINKYMLRINSRKRFLQELQPITDGRLAPHSVIYYWLQHIRDKAGETLISVG